MYEKERTHTKMLSLGDWTFSLLCFITFYKWSTISIYYYYSKKKNTHIKKIKNTHCGRQNSPPKTSTCSSLKSVDVLLYIAKETFQM